MESRAAAQLPGANIQVLVEAASQVHLSALSVAGVLGVSQAQAHVLALQAWQGHVDETAAYAIRAAAILGEGAADLEAEMSQLCLTKLTSIVLIHVT